MTANFLDACTVIAYRSFFLEQGVIPIFFYYLAGLIIITHSAINAVDAVFKCTQN